MPAHRRAIALTAFVARGPCALHAQRNPIVVARDSARAYRERNEAAIIREFASLLSIPNLATDSADITHNADTLVAMLTRRGFRNAPEHIVPGGPPAVSGELPAPESAYAARRSACTVARNRD